MNRYFQFSILLVDQVTILAHRGYALLTSLRFPVVPCKKLQLIQQNHFRGQEKEEKKDECLHGCCYSKYSPGVTPAAGWCRKQKKCSLQHPMKRLAS